MIYASILTFTARRAYIALGLLIGLESMGVPLPGETSLIAAGILASDGRLDITLVIVIAASAAIIGDNLGYLLGRTFGRWALERPGAFEHHRRALIARGEPFFERHGAKAVFFGRWFSGLRIAAAWLAGVAHLRWTTFLLWNALGGIAWATSVGIAAYLLGPTAKRLFHTLGIGGLGLFVAVALGVYLVRRRRDRVSPADG